MRVYPGHLRYTLGAAYLAGLGALGEGEAQRIDEIRAQYPNYVFAGAKVRWSAEADRPLSSAFRADTYYGYVTSSLRDHFNFQSPRVWGKDWPGRLYVEVITPIDRGDIEHIRAEIEQAVESNGFTINRDPKANTIGVVAEPKWVTDAKRARPTALPDNVPAVPRKEDDRGDGKDALGRDIPKDKGGSFLESLGLGLGLSTPAVIAGLVLLGVVVLKR